MLRSMLGWRFDLASLRLIPHDPYKKTHNTDTKQA